MKQKRYSVDQILEEFNSRSKLSDLISKYVNLTPRGNQFVGKCPFHNEKTPSFNVNDDKGLFHCFGCKVGGNVITFLQKNNNLSFIESIKYLSTYLGIEFNINESRQTDKTIRLLNILEKANSFFIKNLVTNNFAKKYLVQRQISLDAQKFFQVGYCPNDNALIDFFKKNDVSIDELVDADLLIKKKNNFFGRFRDRITFPIFNIKDKVVGFGGRTITDSKIKYINSQESEIFKKSEILYGLTQNISEIRQSKQIIIVEGYLDVIAMYQKNIKIALSTMGTTLSSNQIFKLWNLSDTPYICFDGDKAGKSASENIALKILEFLTPGKSFKFINLPNSEDPDTFFKRRSLDQFEKIKEESKDLSDLIWDIILKSVDSYTPEFLAKIDESIKFYSNKIKNKSVSVEYFRYLREKKNKFFWGKNVITKRNKNQENLEKIEVNINEKLLIVFAIFEIQIFSSMIEEITKVKLKNNKLEEIRNEIIEILSGEHSAEIDVEVRLRKKYSSIIEKISQLNETHLKDMKKKEKVLFLKQILSNLKLPELLNEKEKIKKQILEIKNNEEQPKLITEYNHLVEEIKRIKKKNLE